MNNGNMPAMPTEVTAKGTGIQEVQTSNSSWKEFGLTKREYFAAMAMQGQLAGLDTYFKEGYTNADDPEVIAKNSVDYAEALLKALEANNE